VEAAVKQETVSLELSADQVHTFFPLLQKGVTVPVTVGCTLKSLLCNQLMIPADYVTDRITTIFLDNRPVDDIDRTVIQEGSRVTLSAAMPGLVGATMRRGGFYAALRQGISHGVGSKVVADKQGAIRIKLFNLLLAELGPLVLTRGILLERDELVELLQHLPGTTVNAPIGDNRVILSATFREC